MHGCGNRFHLVDELTRALVPDSQRARFTQRVCSGEVDACPEADGVLFIGASRSADIRMRIFDQNGSEESMCGNGLRCALKYHIDHHARQRRAVVETADGLKSGSLRGRDIEVDMGPARELRRLGPCWYVFTGCPHVVVPVKNMVFNDPCIRSYSVLGASLSHDPRMCAEVGLNSQEGLYVNFVSPSHRILTYERHLERITPACGTGSTAAGIVLGRCLGHGFPLALENRGGRIGIRECGGSYLMTGPAEYIATSTVRILGAAR